MWDLAVALKRWFFEYGEAPAVEATNATFGRPALNTGPDLPGRGRVITDCQHEFVTLGR